MSHLHLTQEDLQKLKNFNMRLKRLQDILIDEARRFDTLLKQRVADVDDLLDDYEIELLVYFCLQEDDPTYDENEDNIITTIDEYLKNISTELQKDSWRWNANHNDFRGKHFSTHPMLDEYHCWWFHCLYDHNNISYQDMLKIGEIFSDLQVHYQYRDI